MICSWSTSKQIMSEQNFDLHCHSNVSDGVLLPADLVARAADRGVTVLALTDHDDVSGLPAAHAAARGTGMKLINGVEISVTWGVHTIHIIGLNIDPQSPALVAGLAAIRSGREERAIKMAEQLTRIGIPNSLAGAYRYVENRNSIGRMHFARYLIDLGIVKDVRTVFKRYLVKGKPGYVPHQWAGMADAIGWITASGGQAVLAHPGRYTMGEGKMQELLTEFKSCGGTGIEVVTGSHTVEQYAQFARLAKKFDLLCSRGSDFHGPDESYKDLGQLPQLPEICTPIWQDWALSETARDTAS